MKRLFLVIYQVISPVVLIPFLIISYIKPWKSGRLAFLKSFIFPTQIFSRFFSGRKSEADSVLLHSVSLGETKVAFKLIEGIGKGSRAVILSTGPSVTPQYVNHATAAHVRHFYAPIDFPIYWYMLIRSERIKRILIVEHDIWPGLMVLASVLGVEVWLVNANVSDRSLQTYQKNNLTSSFVRFIFDCFSRVFVQHDSLERSLVQLGVPPEKVAVSGSLKFLSIEVMSAEAVGERQMVCFGSCHPEEFEFIARCVELIQRKNPAVNFLIVPRHPQAAQQLCRVIGDSLGPIRIIERSPDGDSSYRGITVVAGLGTLLDCYRSSAVSVVCGSFSSEYGGHNLLEPFTFGSIGVYGPFVGAQKDLDGFLVDSGIKTKVSDELELVELVTSLLEDESMRERTVRIFTAALGKRKAAINSSLHMIRSFMND